jgi:hypothetical protein
MRFDDVIEHLSQHGFVTRKAWNGESILFFGKDSLLHISTNDGGCGLYTLKMADIWMNDWIKIDEYWCGEKYNFLPFENFKLKNILKIN